MPMRSRRQEKSSSTQLVKVAGSTHRSRSERNQYYPQFYEPHLHYTAPIFAIPGNHDGDLGIPPVGASLEGFMVNFCATAAAVTPDAKDVSRPAMTQPNCYWTSRRRW